MQANGITNPDVVTAGQTLVIPGSGSGGSSSRSYGSSGRSSGGGTITVQEGDTLSKIADRAGISVNRLMRLNGLSDANKLSIGQKVMVGGGGNGGGGGYTRQATAAQALPTAPYTVKKGETVSELAERFGTTTNRRAGPRTTFPIPSCWWLAPALPFRAGPQARQLAALPPVAPPAGRQPLRRTRGGLRRKPFPHRRSLQHLGGAAGGDQQDR
jgi:LysM repeat protein